MATDVMIEAKGLTKLYGAYRALDKISFKVRRGEVVGFLGPNGAGKSTTMRILTCYLSASGGAAKVHGYDVFDDPLKVRERIGYLPQRAQMYTEMSVWEYLSFVAELRKLDKATFKKRMKNIVEVCGLSTVLGKDIRTLSHGYKQRVGLGQALLHDPPILILDEPTSDLDPNEKAEVIEYIKEIGRDRTVVLSTHNLAEVEAACARAIIISKGRVVADGSIDDVRARGGRVRYHVIIHEQESLNGQGPPKARDVEDALRGLEGIMEVKETPTDDKAHAFALLGPKGSDLRAEIYKLAVKNGWCLLEMTRSIQKLEDVFKALTRGEEALTRGRKPVADDLDDEDDDLDDDEEDLEDEEGDDDDEDDDEDEDEDKARVVTGAAGVADSESKSESESESDDEDEEEEEEEEEDEEEEDEEEEEEDEEEEEEEEDEEEEDEEDEEEEEEDEEDEEEEEEDEEDEEEEEEDEEDEEEEEEDEEDEEEEEEEEKKR